MTPHPEFSRAAATAPTAVWSRRRTLLAMLAVFLLAVLLYLPTLQNEFVWDDVALIENTEIRTFDAATVRRSFTTNFWEATETHSGLYRPLTALSFHADYRLYGNRPAGFHLTNTVLNALVCVLVFLAWRGMFGRADVALVASLLFAAFPMHTENVAWVSGRTDLIAVLFMTASLACYARWRRHGGAAWVAGVLVCFAAALTAKETAVVLPAVLAVANLVPVAGERAPARAAPRWVLVVVMLAMVAGYFVVRRAVLGAAVTYFPRFTDGVVSATALTLSILAHYAYKLVFPFRLDAEADFPPPATFFNLHTLVGLAIVAGALVALVRMRRNGPVVLGTTVLACGLAPVLNLLPLNQVLAERFLYFPSMGFTFLLALAATAGIRRSRMAVAIAVAALFTAYAARTVARTFDWKDELTLFEKTVAVSGDNARARASFGAGLFKHGRYGEALAEFTRATEINPAYAPGWSGRARAAAELGQVDEALAFIQTAIALESDDALLHHHQGVLRFRAGDYAGAAESFRRALEIRPRHHHARFNLGLALYQQRDFAGAAREFAALEHKDTDFVNAWFFLAESKLQRGDAAAAADAARRFLSLHVTEDAMAARAREIAGRE